MPRDLRLVLVITGKGRADETPFQPRRHGILRHSLPHWLAAPPLGGRILQVAPRAPAARRRRRVLRLSAQAALSRDLARAGKPPRIAQVGASRRRASGRVEALD